MPEKIPVYSAEKDELEKLCAIKEKYRTSQICGWLFKKKVISFAQMSNVPKNILTALEEHFTIHTLTPLADADSSRTETFREAFRTADGKIIEAVFMNTGKNRTACLSSQSGCPLACSFCASGSSMSFGRSLAAHEIIEQFILLNRKVPEGAQNIVFMGMGEPFLNQDEVFRALRIFLDADKFAIAPKRITVSTAGIPKGIADLAGIFPKVNLAVSLHSALQPLRDELMPGLKKIPLSELRRAVFQHINNTELAVTIEYLMLDKINDSPAHAEALAAFCRGMNCIINLIPFNRYPGCSYQPSSRSAVRFFQETLEKKNLEVVQRFRRGDDINAACGQLGAFDCKTSEYQ
ncbi:MAG: 23S rRNA (adenine(2503)-C(2))-methyltransferase [Spirochaetes bacterium GWF1_41_5]|nr:MAG: 23S rRNA (adenine(2503)-C(2))-methyltransferase [Spirochaetes bacterium GWF1_41_5]HBE02660.1 23S rRNA (adenine(2503)-C(2))-methyltransferase RlmN [Spirochaetia bacterium]